MTAAVVVPASVVVAAAWGYVAFEEANAVLKARVVSGVQARPLRVRMRSRVTAALATGAPLPVRVAVGALLGLSVYLLGANVVVALIAWVVGATALQTISRARAAIRHRRVVEQMPAFLSGVLMSYLTEGSLPRAVEKMAPDVPNPLGAVIRGAIAPVRANVGGMRRTVGEVLWDQALDHGIRSLQRLAHTLQQAEKGAASAAVYKALEDIEKELREDERLQRGRILASRQSTLIVQLGAVGAGAFYVALGLMGYGRIMRSGFGVLVTAVAAALVGVSLLIAYAAARRAAPGQAAHKRG